MTDHPTSEDIHKERIFGLLGTWKKVQWCQCAICSCHCLESKSFCIEMRILVNGIAKDIMETRMITAPISHG